MTCQFCKIEHRVTVPTRHLNGTSAGELCAQLDAAIEAIAQVDAAIEAMQTAIERLVEATPNGRDYYVQDAGAIDRALGEHNLRFECLQAPYLELVEMRAHVVAVMDFKEAQKAQARKAVR